MTGVRAPIHVRRVGLRAAGPVTVLVTWQVLALTVLAGRHTVPTPTSVLARFVSDLGFARPHVLQTAREAALGWLYGNALAIGVGLLFVMVPIVDRIVFRVFVALYCLPLVAIAPVLSAVMSGDAPEQVVAAQGVFFTTLVAVMVGARSADPVALDLVRAAGGGRLQQVVRVRLYVALPSLFAGLRVAGPAAVLGAVIGEYLGGSSGIGVAMIYSEQSLDVTRTWALALDTTLLAAAAYLVIAAAARLIVPWAREAAPSLPPHDPGSGSSARRVALTTCYAVLSVAVIIGVWAAVLRLMGWNTYFAKGPSDVWRFVATGPDAASHRSVLVHALLPTLRDSGLGLIVGGVGALLLAVLIVSSPMISALVMPIAVAVRVVPLVAMTPLIALVFGRGLTTVAVIAGLVTFFPVLVAVVAALRASPAQTGELVAAYGGSRWATLRFVQLPGALPAVLGASRIAAPTAVLGALLAEWLATGDGIGAVMYSAPTTSQYGLLWSAVALITFVCLLVYGAASAAESYTLRRLSGASA